MIARLVRRLRRAAAAATVILSATFAAAEEGRADPAAREWTQWAGNAARTGVIDLEPVRYEPVDAWSFPLDGKLVAHPVTWGGVVYFVVERNRGVWLHAVRISDGAAEGLLRLGAAEPVGLATGGTMVLVSQKGQMRGIRHAGGRLSTGWTVRHEGEACPPTVWRGRVFYDGTAGPEAADAASGALREGTAARMHGPATVRESSRGIMLATLERETMKEYHGLHAILRLASPVDLSASFGSQRVATIAETRREGRPIAPRFLPGAFDGAGGWFVLSGDSFKTTDGTCRGFVAGLGSREKDSWVHPLHTEPVLYEDQVLGFDREGNLLRVLPDGRYGTVVQRRHLPSGAQPAPGTGARDVIYFAHWALDTSNWKVLWVRPDLATVEAAVPVADGRVLVVLKDRLVCLADGGAAAATAATPGTGTAPGARTVDLSEPGPRESPGVVTRDGQFHAGVPHRVAAGRFALAPTGAAPPEDAPRFRIDDLCLLVHDAERTERTGPEGPVLEVLRARIRRRHVERLADIARRAVGKRIVDLAHGLIAEAREEGLTAEETDALKRSLAGLRPNPRPGNLVDAMEAERAASRRTRTEDLRAAARWCAGRRLPGAASVLFLEAAGPDWSATPAGVEAMRADVAPLVPAAFPWKSNEKEVEIWLHWIPHLLQTEAEFVSPLRPELVSRLVPPWNQGTVYIATPEILLASRCLDPVVVATCLDAADGAVRALHRILGPDDLRPATGLADLLDVRLYRDEKEFRSVRVMGSFPMPWSAGFYAPPERISRFFPPRDSEGDVLGRGLREVAAHEVTHHFLHVRWTPAIDRAVDPGAPGFWSIEGIARFIEDQVTSPTARAWNLDDPTVPSMETMVAGRGQGMYFRPSEFLDLSHQRFHRIGDEVKWKVRLSRSLETRLLSDRHVFYEQAGATVFFLLHRGGEERRRAFLSYLASVYAGRPPAPAWRALGWEASSDLDRAFLEFLEAPR